MTLHKPKHKVTIVTPTRERIVDTINKNNFGILFHDMKSIEDFQRRSGMEGAYSTEYQHHYTTLVGRLEADGQVMDLAIPMTMYNYHQEVSTTHVEFNLTEAHEAGVACLKLAEAKSEEFQKTEMFKKLWDMGITDWTLHLQNSIHAHPAGVNRFSGTDLRTDINHPGVNFPLSTGKQIPNYASIIQHKSGYAEIIHTEYRMFNGEEGGERHYAKGRTLTLCRGYIPKVPEPRPLGLIDSLFGVKAVTPPTPKERKSYILEDGFTGVEVDVFNAIKKEMMTMWAECPFKIDISQILKTNVLKGQGRLQKKTVSTITYPTSNRNQSKKQNAGKKDANATSTVADSLFPADWSEEDVAGETEYTHLDVETPVKGVSLNEMIAYLVSKDYIGRELEDWSINEIVDTYKTELFDEQADANAGIIDYSYGQKRKALVKDGYNAISVGNMTDQRVDYLFSTIAYPEIETEEDDEENLTASMAKAYLRERDYGPAMLEYMTDHRAFELYYEEKNNEELEKQENERELTNEQAAINEIRSEIISMLVDDKIISAEKLVMMSDENLVKFCEEVYGAGIMDEIVIVKK